MINRKVTRPEMRAHWKAQACLVMFTPHIKIPYRVDRKLLADTNKFEKRKAETEHNPVGSRL